MVTLATAASEEVVACRHCGCLDDVVRHGFTPGGNQRYRCLACKKTFCLNPGSTAPPPEFRERVLSALQEGCSQRGTCRITQRVPGNQPGNLTALAEKKAAETPYAAFAETIAPAERGDVLEADELWSFVG